MGGVVAVLIVLVLVWLGYGFGYTNGRIDMRREICTKSGGVPVTQLIGGVSTVYCQPRPDWDKK